jgi:hypothetical protein
MRGDAETGYVFEDEEEISKDVPVRYFEIELKKFLIKTTMLIAIALGILYALGNIALRTNCKEDKLYGMYSFKFVCSYYLDDSMSSIQLFAIYEAGGIASIPPLFMLAMPFSALYRIFCDARNYVRQKAKESYEKSIGSSVDISEIPLVYIQKETKKLFLLVSTIVLAVVVFMSVSYPLGQKLIEWDCNPVKPHCEKSLKHCLSTDWHTYLFGCVFFHSLVVFVLSLPFGAVFIFLPYLCFKFIRIHLWKKAKENHEHVILLNVKRN